MKRFDIWMEGYAATGESGVAHVVSSQEAESFDEACEKYAAEYNPPVEKENAAAKIKFKPNTMGWFGAPLVTRSEDGSWSLWGCRFFDNSHDAQRSFG